MNNGDSKEPVERPVNTVGVKLHPTGRTYELDAGVLTLRRGQRVIIQGENGHELGVVAVASAPRPSPGGRLPRVVRVADERDLERLEANTRRAAEALAFGREMVRARKIPVKMFRAELHQNGKATFYFASENRIDFRDLVRDLGDATARCASSCARSACATKPRWSAASARAVSSCAAARSCRGSRRCRSRWPSTRTWCLNPAKVSGQCGRLKCCLVYEEANYVEAAKGLPKLGKRVSTPEGEGRVGDLDVLRGRVRVYFQDGPPQVFSAAVSSRAARRRTGPSSGRECSPTSRAPR